MLVLSMVIFCFGDKGIDFERLCDSSSFKKLTFDPAFFQTGGKWCPRFCMFVCLFISFLCYFIEFEIYTKDIQKINS